VGSPSVLHCDAADLRYRAACVVVIPDPKADPRRDAGGRAPGSLRVTHGPDANRFEPSVDLADAGRADATRLRRDRVDRGADCRCRRP
jgi:hypothetical protein